MISIFMAFEGVYSIIPTAFTDSGDFDPASQRVLGVTIVGESACELIHVGMTVIALEGTLDFFIQAAFGFPSLSDAYKYAAYDGLQQLQRRRARTPGLPTAAVTLSEG